MRTRRAIAIGLGIAGCCVPSAVVWASHSSTRPSSAAVDVHRLPLGDGRVSTTSARAGWVYECTSLAGGPGGGAFRDGPWIHSDGTFDQTAKPTVDGAVSWPTARVRITSSHGRVRISGNGLPVGATTGNFPISSSDDAYAYDRNPNMIEPQRFSFQLPAARRAARPHCLGGGAVGYAVNGVAIFDALDAQNRDAVAHEIQDSCGGHPQRSGMYHYHSVPACLAATVHGTGAKVVGWMLDGYPLVSEPGVTNASLDACHGRTSTIRLFGRRVRAYHYDATAEYPYTIGCYRGTPLRAASPGPP